MDDKRIVFYEDCYTETFVKDMTDYLMDTKKSKDGSPYRDLDAKGICLQYYRDLTTFLNSTPLKAKASFKIGRAHV